MNPTIGKALNEALFRLQAEGRDEPCIPNRHFYEIEEGKKFLKVIRTNGTPAAPTGGRSVFFFVDKTTGDVFKPAGWKSPARGARFNLLDPASLARMTATADRHGSFLYLRG
jgi:hypothetical protein